MPQSEGSREGLLDRHGLVCGLCSYTRGRWLRAGLNGLILVVSRGRHTGEPCQGNILRLGFGQLFDPRGVDWHPDSAGCKPIALARTAGN